MADLLPHRPGRGRVSLWQSGALAGLGVQAGGQGR